MSTSYNHTGTRVLQFLVLETGIFGTQYRRPYATTFTGQVLNQINERAGGSYAYKPSLMAGVANQFIMPQAQPEKQIVIPNGWQERRLRFQLMLEHTYRDGSTITEMVMGYSEHPGITMSGALDPTVEFFINSTVHLRTTVARNPYGTQTHLTIADSSHVIADNDWGGIHQPLKDQKMRPEDVYTSMSASLVRQEAGGDFGDTRIMLTSDPIKSRRSNGMATDYMSRILDNYRKASMISNFGEGAVEVFSEARGNVAENNVSDDPFISAIAQIRGTHLSNTFTVNDLLRLDPNTQYVTKATMLDPNTRAVTDFASISNDWGRADRATQVATILSQSVPGLLMELALTGAIIQATNMTIGGVPSIGVSDYNSFSNEDMTQYIEMLKIRLETEVLRDLSYDNQIGYAIEMQVDLFNTTRLHLQLDGYDYGEFITPSFCDAMMAPVITGDKTRTETVSSDFDALFSQLIQPSTHQNAPIFGNF